MYFSAKSSIWSSASSPTIMSTTRPMTSTFSIGLSRAVIESPTRGSRRRLRSLARPTAVLNVM
jgi:hypothetical protein